MNNNAMKNSFNPIFMKQFIDFMDGDETKGMNEQEMIRKQQEEIELLEEEIYDAKV
jgi:hypothetical protein